MTQYDAGPGDWSDREWDASDREPQPHAKRRRVVLPPWALLAVLGAIVILLCVGLVLIVRAIRGGSQDETTAPTATVTMAVWPSETAPLITPTAVWTETMPTTELPTATPIDTPSINEFKVGATVVVKGTGGGLNLRAEPTTESKVVATPQDGTELTVLDGPVQGDGYVWWKLRTPKGKEGWGAQQWLGLKAE